MTNLFNEVPIDQRKESVAVISGEDTVTFGQLGTTIAAVSRELEDLDLAAWTTIGVTAADPIEFLAAMYGCFRAGLVAVPALDNDVERVKAAFDQAGVHAVVQPGLEIVSRESSARPVVADTAIVMFTSGTTGNTRKGVLLSHSGISSTCRFMNREMGASPRSHEIVFGALDHAFVFGRCHSILSAGGTVELPKLLRIGDIGPALEAGANMLSCPPSTLAALLRHGSDEIASWAPRLETLQTGAMRFDKALRDELCTLLPTTRIYLHYGLSEAMRTTFVELQANPTKRHTEGRPADGVQIEIRDEKGNALPAGEEGLIAISGANLCNGYLDQDVWETQYSDGWFTTSDRGALDDDGFLFFSGRADDAVNSNGNIVHPDEVEQHLRPLFGSQELVVFGAADPAGVRDSILVLCTEGPTELTIRDVRQQMKVVADYLVPQRLVHLEALPRTRTGKISRAETASLVADSGQL